jgi:hypothetical protein
MAGRFQGYHAIRREETEGYLKFEVFWQNDGWFWRPLFQLDGEALDRLRRAAKRMKARLLQMRLR